VVKVIFNFAGSQALQTQIEGGAPADISHLQIEMEVGATGLGTAFRARGLADVLSNEENIKQDVAKVQWGEADAGIVYTSDAVAAPELKIMELPSNRTSPCGIRSRC